MPVRGGLRGLFGRSRGRRRIAQVRRRFDEDAGYREFHEFCQSQLARDEGSGANPLLERGWEGFCVIDTSAAADLRREVETRFACSVEKEKSPHLLVYHIDDPSFDARFLERVTTPAVDERALRFFQSEYLVLWYTLSRTIPVATSAKNSFLWHCDRGPHAHLKLLLYLNDYEEHCGGTEFLDLPTTDRISESGYVYAPVRTRVADLGEIAARVSADYAPWEARMDAGEGILFQPASVLHRGLLPMRGPRLVATLCLLPSPVPWREALDRGVKPRPNSEAKWPDVGALRLALADR